jgi:hypothetical protein
MSRATSKSSDAMSRRDLAAALGVHPDTVSRNVHFGLAGAVIVWGGRGKQTMFSFRQARRWHRAWQCRQRNEGHACRLCRNALFDCESVGEHLLAARQGLGSCRECRASWPLVQPCSAAS